MRADFAAQQIRFAAIAVFGDKTMAKRWTDEPNASLGGVTPATCGQTAPGLLQVLRLLSAIENGTVV